MHLTLASDGRERALIADCGGVEAAGSERWEEDVGDQQKGDQMVKRECGEIDWNEKKYCMNSLNSVAT